MLYRNKQSEIVLYRWKPFTKPYNFQPFALVSILEQFRLDLLKQSMTVSKIELISKLLAL